MPYSRVWDESTPDGSTFPADDIDTAIQDTKEDVRERIAQVIPGWTDEDEDPKRAVIQVGLIAARPADVDSHEGEYYYATDEGPGTLYLFDGVDWVQLATATVAVTLGRVKLVKGATQALAHATPTEVAFDDDDIEYEVGGDWFDEGTSVNDIVVPADQAGFYLITAYMHVDAGSTPTDGVVVFVDVKLNGTSIIEASNFNNSQDALADVQTNLVVPMVLAEGDVLTFEVSQVNGDSSAELIDVGTQLAVTRLA
jgi:hypothetical protein